VARLSARSRPRSGPRPRAARWKLFSPAQARSQETVELFARAAEELLAGRSFEEITVQDIVGRAGRPIGSFYARFASKEALLPYLYQRYHDGLESAFATRLGRVDWENLELDATVEQLVGAMMGMFTDRPWLIRALALFSRARPEALPADLVIQRRRVYDLAVAILARHGQRIRHPDSEAAIRFGLFVVNAVAREKLLFAEAPHSRVTPVSRATLRRELTRTLTAYLTSEVR
jgi:AcrR family transcriptional regulator